MTLTLPTLRLASPSPLWDAENVGSLSPTCGSVAAEPEPSPGSAVTSLTYRLHVLQAANLTDVELAAIATRDQDRVDDVLRPVVLEMARRLDRRPRIEKGG